MNFDVSPDQKALRDQARKFLSEHASSTRVRRILDTDEPCDRDLWRGVAEMCWTGTAIPEAYGGAGFGHLELCVIAEELGRCVAPIPFSSTVYLGAEVLLLAGTDGQRKHWLPWLRCSQRRRRAAPAMTFGSTIAGLRCRLCHRTTPRGPRDASRRQGDEQHRGLTTLTSPLPSCSL